MIITAPNVLSSTGAVDVRDDILFTLGTDSDGVILNRSATLTANTALTGVLEGTPVTPALAANSLIISNQTNDGDILIAVSDGGNSQGLIHLDGDTGKLSFPLGFGAYGVAAPAQAAHIGNTAGDDATAVNAILVVLENLGFTATS